MIRKVAGAAAVAGVDDRKQLGAGREGVDDALVYLVVSHLPRRLMPSKVVQTELPGVGQSRQRHALGKWPKDRRKHVQIENSMRMVRGLGGGVWLRGGVTSGGGGGGGQLWGTWR